MQLKEILSIEENRTVVHRDRYVGSLDYRESMVLK